MILLPSNNSCFSPQLLPQVFQEDVEKDAKAFSKAKQGKTKAAFERLVASQRELQVTVGEVRFSKEVIIKNFFVVVPLVLHLFVLSA